MNKDNSYFFCGIGGSGMLPLAMLLNDAGASVAGSDRALDQGRIGAKFDYLAGQGIGLFAQDGSGLVSGDQILVASAAIEDTVPDVARANALGCRRMTRAELLSELFNAAPVRIAIGGTSGKSTVTGMIGWIMAECGRDPTIMNGAVMKNFVREDAPFASSRSGAGPEGGGLFVSEVDESDGSIALFHPTIAVLNNVSLDHKTLEELHALFGDFVAKGDVAIWNADDAESIALMAGANPARAVSFGFNAGADFRAVAVEEAPFSAHFTLQTGGANYPVTMAVPGRHNIANGLAALAAAQAAGVPLPNAIAALGSFNGLKRRFELVGQVESGGEMVTVIDDFGHNPEKIAATLGTLKAFDGRVLAFFQPHGFGPLRVMGEELAAMFADILGGEDRVLFCDPVYFGGTVDRSVGSAEIVASINAHAGRELALHIPDRADCGAWLSQNAAPGDRIVIMGARDDSLSPFAAEVLAGIEAR
jgi:UDP-N-acetylmuramate--alanine ligase